MNIGDRIRRVENLLAHRGNRDARLAVSHTVAPLSIDRAIDHQVLSALLTSRQRVLKATGGRVD